MCPSAYAPVSTVKPNASETPTKPMPRFGNAAARTALPQPPRTSHNVPMNSADNLFVKGIRRIPPFNGLLSRPDQKNHIKFSNSFEKAKEKGSTFSFIRSPFYFRYGGEGGIRTHGTLSGSTVFETARFNHSRTSPFMRIVHSKGCHYRYQVAHILKYTWRSGISYVQFRDTQGNGLSDSEQYRRCGCCRCLPRLSQKICFVCAPCSFGWRGT